MLKNLKRIITPARLRNLVFFLLLGVAGVAVRSTTTQMHTATTCPPCYSSEHADESFDNEIPPALPTDWLATNALGPPPLWVTSNTGVPGPPADTPPNSVLIDDPAVLSDKRLDSLSLQFFHCCGQVTFRHNFNLEASEVDPNVGFDGGVLEISTDGGNIFRDVLAAGGSFLMGGYNRTIANNRGSPIAGRQAWSGNSQGFITTVIDLPFPPAGAVRFRWRMASDNTGSGEGWRVDTINVTWCKDVGCPHPTPTIIPTPRPRPTPALRPGSSAPPTPYSTPAFSPPPRPSP